MQDDWKLTRRLKFNYGLRYDLYRIPKADPTSPFPASQKFNVDKNNFAPRLGVVYALREGNRPTILRAGAGIYYDQPLLAMYQRALQNNGNPKFFSFSFSGNTNGILRQPNCARLSQHFFRFFSRRFGLPPQNIDTIAPDFENMYAIHSNIQLEQAMTDDLSLAVGLYSFRRPSYSRVSQHQPDSDPFSGGRQTGIWPCQPETRLDPRFNNIQMVESAGVSQYDALTLQLTQTIFARASIQRELHALKSG